MSTLPTPSADALEHSQTLSNLIREKITKNQGAISFADFMELALYAPGLGYYSAGSQKLGASGDFITAPEISPLFARCIAHQCHPILTALDHGSILELGAGTGKFARDLLQELSHLNCLPENYFILEVSAELRERQKIFLKKECIDFFERIVWLDKLPHKKINGIIFANEVMDAMPIHFFQIIKNKIIERGVDFENDHFVWKIIPEDKTKIHDQLTTLQNELHLQEGYISEINTLLPSWIKSLENALNKGVILLFDYGFGRAEYYHPDRNMGTLMCHYQHHRHSDPFLFLGLQDITAHVDFTTVAESAVNANLQIGGYTTQAAFLLNCGILKLAEQQTLSDVEHYKQNQAIKLLTLPSQMGELIKVIALKKNIDMPLKGFAEHDRRRDL
ncbi:MAG: SAM-dependent methyltransferase [Gammaproteobacteria bacterium]|nr:SAM-dependent methyltransferase [Gammaproteobacteria bacterium]